MTYVSKSVAADHWRHDGRPKRAWATLDEADRYWAQLLEEAAGDEGFDTRPQNAYLCRYCGMAHLGKPRRRGPTAAQQAARRELARYYESATAIELGRRAASCLYHENGHTRQRALDQKLNAALRRR